MVVRSVNLKMILPRSEAGRSVRTGLWWTHSAVNHAVAEIEDRLLLCHGRPYNIESGGFSAADVAKAALTMARQVQSANGRPVIGTDEELLTALRQLYEAIVPSVQLDKREGRFREAPRRPADLQAP